ncbi:T9SS type A sorting domain-containing protein [Tenacibaculum maritimum]|uniref:T9SS type A sorting domain-containing protein n=1 Tax=Tenacibaculum maritimum TaxID=107401 RepID=UPI001E4536DF|nr:T9SS type A sorting domain-containing protein [Tenacibaculum maritimum]MCD9583868.1 T9SS type A sorting domain-containing protein [Tenacibaculum maritimum]MCD9620574.1 T9SS type A sorting domain-containing protein [Tenacibaculum maritimum]MCD9626579.1 T9SS type A sorting domain-containing protein [Tenacibaculum maritimum]MCD9629293.1 T9SS type A sorting domain-containing protein [Tenacibaculum maritimum]MCD9632012.1 T9SS type A sorting domain-containing protein [Tenacibaculum maritimum]
MVNLTSSYGLTLNGNDLYVSEINGGKIFKIDLAENSPTPVEITTGLNFPNALTLSGNYLYISELNAKKVVRIDTTKTTPVSTDDITTESEFPSALTSNESNLYIADFSKGEVLKVSLNTTLSIDDVSSLNKTINIHPNPSTDFIYFSNLTSKKNYTILNASGVIISNGSISNQEKIDISNYASGTYFLKFNNNITSIKFIKQ